MIYKNYCTETTDSIRSLDNCRKSLKKLSNADCVVNSHIHTTHSPTVQYILQCT